VLERRRAELAMAARIGRARLSLKATAQVCDSLRFQSLIGQLVGVAPAVPIRATAACTRRPPR